MSRRRTLRPDEHEVWAQVARTARPMHQRRPGMHETMLQDPLPASQPAHQNRPEPPAPLPDLRIGSRAPGSLITHDILPNLPERLAREPVRMDAATHKAMRAGRLRPEARIDLHGLTLAEAQPELVRFILTAHSAGRRLVLVITGKGKDRDSGGPIPARLGALRHQVPHWLGLPPLRGAVLQVTEAHQRHGGAGAYYVYLRRAR